MKPADDHIDFLDLFRGLAIFMVFLFHSLGASFGNDNLPWNGVLRDYSYSKTLLALLPLTYGKMGVALFFVISGFCIHLSFQKHQSAGFKPFFIRRFWRIFPPYLLALLLFAFLLPSSRISFDATGWLDLLAHALALQNFFDASFYSINPSFWSIAVEVQLYLLYPLLLVLVSRLGWTRTLVILAVIEGTIRAVTGIAQVTSDQPLPRWFTDSPLAYWLSWSLGAWLAEAWRHRQSMPIYRVPITLWLALTIICYQVKFLEPFTFTFASLLTFAVLARLLEQRYQPPARPHLILRHLQSIGLWSYSLYLLHQPFLLLIPWLKARWITGVAVHPLVTLSACLLLWFVLVPLGIAFYRLVEVPSIALGKKFLPKRQR